MAMREKLIELLMQDPELFFDRMGESDYENLADYLIANGVIIPVKCDECKYYSIDKDMCGRQVCMSTHRNGFCDFGKTKEDTEWLGGCGY